MIDQRKQMAEARSNIYQFLSQVYLAPPSEKFIKRIIKPGFLESLIDILGYSAHESEKLRIYLTSKTPEELLDELVVEYNSLFEIPTSRYIKPYESVYLDSREINGSDYGGLVMGPSTIQVKDIYLSAGMVLSGSFKDLPDHLAVELEFMAYLADKESKLSDSAAKADEFLVLQYQFLKNHLSQWVDMVCEAILDNTENPFYEAIGTLTSEFVLDESNIEKIQNC